MASSPVNVSGKHQLPLNLLNYDPLPNATSIRLLEILPSSEDEVCCSLATVDLDDQPIFDALSYTWGDPITVQETADPSNPVEEMEELAKNLENRGSRYPIVSDMDAMHYRIRYPYVPHEKVAWNGERRHPIRCNGSAVMVTENLIRALKMLRRLSASDNDHPQCFEKMTGNPTSRYVWVDMICINQDDIDERNTQIRLMGRIFFGARAVIGWLGPEANQSRLVSEAFGNFWHGLMEAKSLDTLLNPSVAALFSLKGITEEDVYAIFAFFQRLWFRRAWVVQEAVLARKLVLCCGGVIVQWGILDFFVTILQRRNLYHTIAEFGVALMRGGPSNKGARAAVKAGAPIIGCGPERTDWDGKLQVDPLVCRDFVLGVGLLRRAFGWQPLYYSTSSPQVDYAKPSDEVERSEGICRKKRHRQHMIAKK